MHGITRIGVLNIIITSLAHTIKNSNYYFGIFLQLYNYVLTNNV